MTLRGMTVLAPVPSKAPRIKMIFLKISVFHIDLLYLELSLMVFGQNLEILAIVIIQKLNIAGSINLFTLNSMQG